MTSSEQTVDPKTNVCLWEWNCSVIYPLKRLRSGEADNLPETRRLHCSCTRLVIVVWQPSISSADYLSTLIVCLDAEDERPSVKHQAEASSHHRGDRFVLIVWMIHEDERQMERDTAMSWS